MFLRSNRTATKIVDSEASNTEIKTVKDFLTIINLADIQRVEIENITTYRSHCIGSGSQCRIFDDRGMRRAGLPSAVIKCSHFQLSLDKVWPQTENRQVRTIKAMT